MKRRFHLNRARYFGVAKTQAQMAWAALGLNLLKAMKKLQSERLQPCAGSSPSSRPLGLREGSKVVQNALKPVDFFRIMKFTTMAPRSAIAGWVMQQSQRGQTKPFGQRLCWTAWQQAGSQLKLV